jgi:hypothetical protein
MLPDVTIDDRANAHVLGAVLLVIIAIAGVAVVGVVAFDLEERYLEEERPSVSFNFEYDEEREELTVRHHSGRTLQGDRVEFVSDGATLGTWASEPNVTASDEITISGVRPGQTVIVYWYDPNDDRHELRRWHGPARDGSGD